MSASDWAEIIGSLDGLGRFYGDSVPAPGDCKIFYAHVDERGESVTVGLETRVMPLRPADAWSDTVYNALEFYLVFSGVEDFLVDRWGCSEAAQFDLGLDEDGMVSVVLGSESSGIRFRAASVGVEKVRVYLAGAE
ncbi:MAG TPA: Imm50 family immunity protein [Streptomyces sp.]